MTDRQSLEADLIRYQDSGDFAAQAETLFALGELAAETAFEDASFHHVQGLYGQAWAAYRKAGSLSGEANVIKEIAEIMSREIGNHDDHMPLEFDAMHIRHLQRLALKLCIEIGDLRGQAEMHRTLGEAARNREEELDAFQKALAAYEALENVQMQAHILTRMRWTRTPEGLRHDPRPYLEKALTLYQHLGDRQREASILLELGYISHRDKNACEAYLLLKECLGLFLFLGSPTAFSAAGSLGALLLETEGYCAYHFFQMYIVRQLCQLWTEDDDNMMFFWRDLARVARKHQDFETACYAYQQANLYIFGFDSNEKCADLYWRWGHIEYHHLKHPARGIALCESAVALMSDPETLSGYQNKLNHMRGVLAAHQRKNLKTQQ